MRRIFILFAELALCGPLLVRAGEAPPLLLKALEEELTCSMSHLATEDGSKPYFLSYTVTDTTSASVRGSFEVLCNHRWNSLMTNSDAVASEFVMAP